MDGLSIFDLGKLASEALDIGDIERADRLHEAWKMLVAQWMKENGFERENAND